MAGTTWNPASITAVSGTIYSLSNGNLTATANNATNFINIKTLDNYSSGKYYWEVGQLNGNNGSGFNQFGVCNSTAANNAGDGGTVYLGDGRIFNPAGLQATGDMLGSVGTVCIAFDVGNALIWFRVNNGNWNFNVLNNPTIGIGGISTTGITLPFVATASQGSIGGTPSTDLLRSTAAAMAFTPPTGFTVGLPAGAIVSTSNFFFAS